MTGSSILPVAIRPGRIADAPVLFAIHVDAVTTGCRTHYAPHQIRNWFAGRRPEEYGGHLRRGDIWVAEGGDRILGFTECRPGGIDRLFVRPDSGGRGVGGRLLGFAIAIASAHDTQPIRIEATLNARTFYERHGFRAIGNGWFRQPSGVVIGTVLMERPASEA